MALPAGARLDRFVLGKKLGKGAAGSVFEAEDTVLGVKVCLKLLHEGLAAQPVLFERFKREILLARRISHPSICRLFDLHLQDDVTFLSMEHIEGEVMTRLLTRKGFRPVGRSVRLIRRVCEALHHAHEAGVVHRDLKPANIMVRDQDEISILDFGVATAGGLSQLTTPGAALGSRRYIAPEVWEGKGAEVASDVYSVGVILYALLTKKLPFDGPGVTGVLDAIRRDAPAPPSSINPAVSTDLDAVVRKAIAVDPGDRFADAMELFDALERFVHDGVDEDAARAASDAATDATLSAEPGALNDATESMIGDDDTAQTAEGLARSPHARKLVSLAAAGSILVLVLMGLLIWALSRRGPEPVIVIVEAEAPSVVERAAYSAPEAPPAAEPGDEDPVHVSAEDNDEVAERKRTRARPDLRSRRDGLDRGLSERRQQQLVARARSVEKRRRSQGFLRGDLPHADRQLRRAQRLAAEGNLRPAERALSKAESLIGAASIDRGFVQKKLTRFNKLFDKTSGTKKVKLERQTAEVLSDFRAGRYEQANQRLNSAFKLARSGAR